MLKTWPNKKNRRWFLGCLSLFLALAACAAPEPEVCALCGGEPRNVPCLLDSAAGEIGALTGTLVPGKVQFIGCSEAWGAWDSDAKTGQVSVPRGAGETEETLFCSSCRDALADKGTYVMLDLSTQAAPVVYPLKDSAVYDILGWTITVAETESGFDLTIHESER